MRRNAKHRVTVTRTTEIWRKYENSVCCSRATTSRFVDRVQIRPQPLDRGANGLRLGAFGSGDEDHVGIVLAVIAARPQRVAQRRGCRQLQGVVERELRDPRDVQHDRRQAWRPRRRRTRRGPSRSHPDGAPGDLRAGDSTAPRRWAAPPPATSRPSTIVHGRRRELPAPRKDTKNGSVPSADAISASASRNATASSTPGSAAMAAAVSWMRPMRGPVPGIAGVAMMRTLNPPRSSSVLHGQDETARQQQHVEEQRGRGRHPDDPEHGARGLTNQAAPREGQRLHRRARERTLRRSSTQDAPRLASAPSGTAIAIDRSATDGVIRTKTSAVS